MLSGLGLLAGRIGDSKINGEILRISPVSKGSLTQTLLHLSTSSSIMAGAGRAEGIHRTFLGSFFGVLLGSVDFGSVFALVLLHLYLLTMTHTFCFAMAHLFALPWHTHLCYHGTLICDIFSLHHFSQIDGLVVRFNAELLVRSKAQSTIKHAGNVARGRSPGMVFVKTCLHATSL